MNSLRKWLYKPKKTDSSLLAQFYFADEDLNQVAAELDSFDGRKDPERCTMLVNQLRVCQDRVLNVIQKIMEEAISTQRANRDFRVKFPDDVLQDSLAGQLWFGAECLAAGSSILNREVESASMRPLARALTKNLDSLRSVLREQCLRSVTEYTDRIREALVIFDKLFAEFELSYVSAMVPVKTMKEYDMLQEVTVLFSETVQRALKLELLSQDMIDDYDPALMFTIPRLAIVCGLLIYPEGPLNPDMEPTNISEMYRPFQTLLIRIRELLYTLSSSELVLLERSLCSSEEPEMAGQQTAGSGSDEGQQQVDQGFHENGDGLPVAENLSPMSTGTGSPETPVNSVLGLLDLDTVSPSSTIVEGNFSFSPPDLQRTSSEELITNLNKSESQDSGLHSENVSTSDTVTVDCVQGVSQDIEGAATLLVVCSETPGVLGSPKDINITDSAGPVKSCECQLNRDSVSSVSSIQEGNSDKTNVNECDNVQSVNCNLVSPGQSPDNLCEAGHRTGCEESSDSWQLCCSIVNEVVEMVLDRHRGRQLADVHCCDSVSDCDTHCDSQPSEGDGVGDGLVEGVVNREDPLTRQYSWQYNVQFALPHISLADPEIDPERASSSSFSSNSTISDNNQPCDSMTEFVIETLAAMGRDTTSTVTTSTDCDSTRSSYSPSTSDTDGRAASSRSAASSNHQTASIPKTHSTNRNSAHPRSAQRSRSNVPSNMVDYLNNAIASGSNSDTKARLDAHPEARGRQDNCDSLEHIHCKTGSQRGGESQTQEDMTTQHGKNNLDSCGSSHSSCPSNASCTSSCSCDKDCCTESETSSCNSDGNDDEEVALAIQAAEMASRSEARSRFRSSNDLIHRLFVCIAGVADQLQTNYASDLRHILKCVFELNSTNLPDPDPEIEVGELAEVVNGPSDVGSGGNVEDRASTNTMPSPAQTGHTGHTGNTVHPNNAGHHRRRQPHTSRSILNEPPEWVPDEEVERCTACKTPFTFVRRRHHCRNCGKIFCGKCSSTTVPLPQYGHQKPVRVCHRCFLFQVSHFTIGE